MVAECMWPAAVVHIFWAVALATQDTGSRLGCFLGWRCPSSDPAADQVHSRAVLTWWMMMMASCTPGDQAQGSKAGQGAHLVDDDELRCIWRPIGRVGHENLEQVVSHPPQVVQPGLEVAISLVVALQVHSGHFSRGGRGRDAVIRVQPRL